MTILAAMGKWNAVYGESISGRRPGPIAPRAWGVTTTKGDRVYLHLLNWADRLLTVPALPRAILKAYRLDEVYVLELAPAK